MAEQNKSKLIVILQAFLMVAIAFAPAMTGFRLPTVPNSILDWIGTFVLVIGIILVVISVRALKKTFTIETAVKQDTKLATDFPFNFSRNPMYVGGLLMCFSWSVLQRSLVAFVFSIALFALLNLKVKIEETNLEKVFGDEYKNYKATVRRFF